MQGKLGDRSNGDSRRVWFEFEVGLCTEVRIDDFICQAKVRVCDFFGDHCIFEKLVFVTTGRQWGLVCRLLFSAIIVYWV